ncbi:tether containing UBX domain for GLUT4 [Rhinophrynus dorsalis]
MAAGGPGVSVLAPNGRRQTVKVTARTPLLQVLEEVCKKQNFNPREYDLKFQRTVLDLSLQWRFANLPNNAKLEMVSCTQQRAGAESTKVRVALQLEDGARLQGQFLCSQTLLDVLSQFPETRTRLEQVDPGYSPVCIYMRDEVTGNLALQQTTLQSLGLTGGSAIIRFVMRKCDQPVHKEQLSRQEDLKQEKPPVCKEESEAFSLSHKETGQPDLSEEKRGPSQDLVGSGASEEKAALWVVGAEDSLSNSSDMTAKKEEEKKVESIVKNHTLPSTSAGSGQSATYTPNTSFIPFQGGGHRLGGANGPARQSDADVPSATAQEHLRSPGPSKPKKSKTDGEEDGISEPIDREPLVCHMDLEETIGHESVELTDDFFEVTMDDVRRRFSELRSERQRLEEAPLMTKALREAQMKEKLERYPKVVLRVLFPDRYVLQGFFRPTETVGAVREFVRSQLEDPELPFYLFITPPRTELKDNTQTLFQAELFPAALIHFGSQTQRGHFLHQQLLQAPVSPSQADVLVARMMPHVQTAPAAPVHENFTVTSPENVHTTPSDSAVSEEESESDSRQHVHRDLGKVPKWLKLPGKK